MTDKSVGREDSKYFGWAIWFWTVFCKQWVWETFCKNWFWQTFCKKWIWKGLRLNVAFENYDKWKGWVYLSPALVLLLIFTVWPIFNTVRMSLLEGYSTMAEANPFHPGYELGFGNFTRVLKYKNFLRCLKNTVILTVLTVPLSTFIALLIAVCLNSIKFLNRFLQTVFFLPYVTNSIAIGMVFYAMFNMIIGGRK